MSRRAWSNESSRRRRIKPSSAELQRDKRITRVTRSAGGRGFVVTGKHRYVDKLQAAGSWLPGKTGIWTDHRLLVRGYRTTPVSGQMFVITKNTGNWTDHRLRVRSHRTSPVSGQINGLSSVLFPPDFGLPPGWAAGKKPMHCERKPKLLEKQNFKFLKIKCIAFARISIHFFLPHMDLKFLLLLIK